MSKDGKKVELKNNDASRGFRRRWKLIHFKEIKQRDLIKDFFHLKLAKEMEGICQFILNNGCQLWERDRGFTETENQFNEISDMRGNSSPEAYFISLTDEIIDQIKEDLIVGDYGIIKTNFDRENYFDIISPNSYKNYRTYCDNHGRSIASHKNYTQHAERFFAEWLGEQTENHLTIKKERKRINNQRIYILTILDQEGNPLKDLPSFLTDKYKPDLAF